jgi:cytochrome c heme-lyase
VVFMQDMNAIVAIHNATNERVWASIVDWEAHQGCSHPRLVRFRGRPREYSPKARILNLLGYKLPFDRHDWIVERCGSGEVRYVVDFYSGAVGPMAPAALHLDVRPALDSPSLLFERLRMQAEHMYRMLKGGR